MFEISIYDKSYRLKKGENLLDGLLKQGVKIPYSCKSGVCHSCLLKVEKGLPPKGSQNSLSNQQIKNNCILACQSNVSNSIQVELMQRNKMEATISYIENLTLTCISMTLSLRFPIMIWIETTIKITINDNTDVTSLCTIKQINHNNQEIIIQIERKAGDFFSSWAHEAAKKGDKVTLSI